MMNMGTSTTPGSRLKGIRWGWLWIWTRMSSWDREARIEGRHGSSDWISNYMYTIPEGSGRCIGLDQRVLLLIKVEKFCGLGLRSAQQA
jgi:hypothetical protein